MTAALPFWTVAGLLALACVWLLLIPLRWSRDVRGRAQSDVAVYKDQLEEVERDLERGTIGEVEAQAARNEISRRLLAADGARQTHASRQSGAATQFAWITVVAMPMIAVPLYLYSGAPGLPSQPFAERLAAAPENQSLEELVARVEEHLRANPADAEGWQVVAPIYARMGRFEDAAMAYGRLIDLDGPTGQRLADLGEAMVFADEGIVSDKAAAVFNRAVELDADNAQARYFQGLAALQEGRTEVAREIWQRLADTADPALPWAQMVARSLAQLDDPAEERLEDAPAAANSIASLPPEERAAAIEAMVEGLDQRLSTDGGTEDEWRRLIRARTVLGDEAAARDALTRGVEDLAPDTAAVARLVSAAREMGIVLEAAQPQ